VLGLDRVLHEALAGYPCGWFSPSYKFLAAVWRTLEELLQGIAEPNKTDRTFTFPCGGLLECWSLDSGDAGRSRAYKVLVVDECALVPNLMDVWQRSLRPTLSDYRGTAWFLSTPKSASDSFAQLFAKGEDPDQPEWKSWRLPTSANPYIHPDEIESARQDLSELAFRQEYLAEFVSWEGSVFRNLLDAVSAEVPRNLIRPSQQTNVLPPWFRNEAPVVWAIGADWAGVSRSARGDFSVFSVCARVDENIHLVELERFRASSYDEQVQRLRKLWLAYNRPVILGESNAIGAPVLESVRRAGIPIRGFVTTNVTKARVIESLALSFERGLIRIPNDPNLLAELSAFEATILQGTGQTRYAAPAGQKDDCVISLALAHEAVKRYAYSDSPAAIEQRRALVANILGGRYSAV
jgi:hypothetical protein